MPLRKSKGQMYEWVTNMHSHLAGKCEHECSYCYVQTSPGGVAPRYQGKVRLLEEELTVDYGTGKTIFIEHMNDLFAENVPTGIIVRVIAHCHKFEGNTYVFQTKNPVRMVEFRDVVPKGSILGTTIETNRYYPEVMGNAPEPVDRYNGMLELKCMQPDSRRFVTVEPVLDCDPKILAGWLKKLDPEFLNIGADSKENDLPEPTQTTLLELGAEMEKLGIPIVEKHNIERLKP